MRALVLDYPRGTRRLLARVASAPLVPVAVRHESLVGAGELDGRMQRVLIAASFGMRAADTADVLGYSLTTVNELLQAARAILGAKNTCHAVALALRTGAID